MLNRKLVEYTDISSKYVKVGVRYRLFVGFLLSVFDLHVTFFPLFSSLVCLRVCVRRLVTVTTTFSSKFHTSPDKPL